MDRLRELASDTAFNAHAHSVMMTQKRGHVQRMDDKEWGFSTCPHPDCVLVRELVPVPPQPVEEFGCENDLPWELCRTCKAKQQAANRAKDGDK